MSHHFRSCGSLSRTLQVFFNDNVAFRLCEVMGCAVSVSPAGSNCNVLHSQVGHAKTTPNNSRITEVTNDLSEKDKALIRRNWKYLACDLTGRGAKVFLRIFRDNPEVKLLFPFHALEGEELIRDANFRGHASRFMQAVGAVVDNIDDFEAALTPLLNGLGQKHIHFRGFNPSLFDAFQEAMLEVWAEDLGNKLTCEGQGAWIKVFGFIKGELQNGYLQAVHQSKQSDGSDTSL